MEHRTTRRLSRRDFLYITGLVTVTLGAQAGFSVAAVKAQTGSETAKLGSANFWNRLEAFLADEVFPQSGLYRHWGYGPDGTQALLHPLMCSGCSCCS